MHSQHWFAELWPSPKCRRINPEAWARSRANMLFWGLVFSQGSPLGCLFLFLPLRHDLVYWNNALSSLSDKTKKKKKKESSNFFWMPSKWDLLRLENPSFVWTLLAVTPFYDLRRFNSADQYKIIAFTHSVCLKERKWLSDHSWTQYAL